ncbi:NAD(P)H-dependent glycerol-3-phosphate dehydrogenase [Mariniluteicoccus flavus]
MADSFGGGESGGRRGTRRIAVMGAGAWGTAFAMVLADAGNDVRLLARRQELAYEITTQRRNTRYLGDVELPTGIRATASWETALDGADAVVLAVPSQQLRSNLEQWTLPTGVDVVSLAKGIEVDTLKLMTEVIADQGVSPDRIIAVSGPNLAAEIAERQPAAAVVACVDHDRAVAFQRACRTTTFRPYTNTDVIGCEIGGATKNAIALAVGFGIGLGFGANAVASVITRGLAETTRLGEALGADPHTFAGLAGLGDLVATCSSPLSRNRSFGEMIGRGATVEEATEASRGVAEGVRSSVSIEQLAARHGVEMPIVHRVVQVLAGEMTSEAAFQTLMARVSKPERVGL